MELRRDRLPDHPSRTGRKDSGTESGREPQPFGHDELTKLREGIAPTASAPTGRDDTLAMENASVVKHRAPVRGAGCLP